MDLFFNAKYVAFLKKFAAKRDIRYYLNGIYFESFSYKRGPDSPNIECAIGLATDGHAMAAIIDTNGWCRPGKMLVTVDDRAAQICASANGAGFGHLPKMVVVRGKRLSIEHISAPDKQLITDPPAPNALEAYLQPGDCQIEGIFPDWRRVLPDIESLVPGAPGTYNSTLIDRCAKAAKLIGDRKYNALQFWSKNGERHNPIVVQYEASPNALTIVMPMRGDMDGKMPDIWKQLK